MIFHKLNFVEFKSWQDYILHLMEFILTEFYSILINFLFLKFS